MVIRVEGTKQGNPVKGRRCDAAVKNLADARGRPSPPGWAVSQAYDALLPLRQVINRVRERLIALTPQLVMAELRTLSHNYINLIGESLPGHLGGGSFCLIMFLRKHTFKFKPDLEF